MGRKERSKGGKKGQKTKRKGGKDNSRLKAPSTVDIDKLHDGVRRSVSSGSSDPGVIHATLADIRSDETGTYCDVCQAIFPCSLETHQKSKVHRKRLKTAETIGEKEKEKEEEEEIILPKEALSLPSERSIQSDSQINFLSDAFGLSLGPKD